MTILAPWALADQADMSVRTLQYLEAGETTPSAQTLQTLREALGDEVFGMIGSGPQGRDKRGRPRKVGRNHD